MYCKLICVFVLLAETSQGWGMVYDIPRELHECVNARRNKTESDTGNPYTPLEEDIHVQCLQEFLWKTDIVNWSSFNITGQEMAYVNSLIPSLVRPRGEGKKKKRATTGLSIRQEYRRLNDSEREAFHDAINIMKSNGTYDWFANLHEGIIVYSAHQGANFFSWHRVYLALFEESLREINPDVSLPYWDSTMDHDMDVDGIDPINSNIWTDGFLGNGNGYVNTGPFKNWSTINDGLLWRNIGGPSRLFRKVDIEKILTRCHTSEICVPTAYWDSNLEYFHGGPHVWIGGLMSGLYTAAQDPVFFLHHAFVDYIWELFRRRQIEDDCEVDPENDYPFTTDELHAPTREMDHFPSFINVDGYNNFWTETWYTYEDSPTCSTIQPSCGTPYLRCDVTRAICISIEKPAMMQSAKASEEAPTNAVGPKFIAPPSEKRKKDAMAVMSDV